MTLMDSRIAKILLLICGVGTLALLAGFGLGRMSRGTVVIYDERAQSEHVKSVLQNSDLAKMVDPRQLERIAKMKPVVKAGSLVVFLSEATGDYAVFDERDPMVVNTTEGGETTLTYYGHGGHVTVDLTYKKGTTELLGCFFMLTGEGGIYGPTKHYYSDVDGDGRFDRFTDRDAGKSYQLKDMQWVLVDSTAGDNGEK